MKLGNSNGNNRGKKYFVRGRDDQDLDVVYAEKAENFAAWFSRNMMAAQSQLLTKGCYNDDVFSDTYLRIYEIIMFTGKDIKDYASYFHRAYYTNFVQHSTKQNRYCELFFNYDIAEENEVDYLEEIESKNKMLRDDIMSYVYDRYNIQEFEIFKMYISMKPAVTYHSLAKMTDSKYYVIQRMVSKIIQDVKDNQSFALRHNELAIAS